ncbi:MAG TPA: NAAT family transporter [Candidatus Thermoplasmatota archaeon]|nr:NAAT family transporter [Candidatus Thermoplasmatota archaeon]
MDLSTFAAVLVSIFAIVNPVGTIPTFVALTAGYSTQERRQVITKAVLVATGVLVVFGLVGERIFDVFSITIPAFRIAGGILIFKIAFDMLHGERPRSDSNEQEITDALERQSVGITPLGVPLLTGPGAITTVMILVATHTSPVDRLFIYLAVGIVFAAAFLLLLTGERLFGFMGRSGLMVFTRIMGLILAALAVQFVVTGLTQALPGLARV